MTVYIDESGNIQFDGSGPYPMTTSGPQQVPEWMKSLHSKILQDSITGVNITYHPDAPKRNVLAVRGSLLRTGNVATASVRAFDVFTVPGPNPPGAWIDFRIAATRKTDDKPGLTKDTVQLYVEKLPTTDSFSFMVDPDMAPTQFDYDWFTNPMQAIGESHYLVTRWEEVRPPEDRSGVHHALG